MKQLIVMVAMIGLGLILFNLIAGDEDGSLISVMSNVWEQEIEHRKRIP
jgi:hypothetical protein